jgi:hypothetical protein
VVYSTHADKMRDALLSHGASVETHLYPGRGHADTAASFTLVARFRTPALEQTLAFLKRVTLPGRTADRSDARRSAVARFVLPVIVIGQRRKLRDGTILGLVPAPGVFQLQPAADRF